MTIARLPFYTDSRSKAAFSSLVRGWKFDEYNSTPREVFNRVAATLSGGYTQTQNSGITFNNGTLKATSGIKATVNGWDIGTSIYAEHSELLQSDLIRVHFTGGSNSRTSYGSITVTLKDGKFAVVDTSFPEVLI